MNDQKYTKLIKDLPWLRADQIEEFNSNSNRETQSTAVSDITGRYIVNNIIIIIAFYYKIFFNYFIIIFYYKNFFNYIIIINKKNLIKKIKIFYFNIKIIL